MASASFEPPRRSRSPTLHPRTPPRVEAGSSGRTHRPSPRAPPRAFGPRAPGSNLPTPTAIGGREETPTRIDARSILPGHTALCDQAPRLPITNNAACCHSVATAPRARRACLPKRSPQQRRAVDARTPPRWRRPVHRPAFMSLSMGSTRVLPVHSGKARHGPPSAPRMDEAPRAADARTVACARAARSTPVRSAAEEHGVRELSRENSRWLEHRDRCSTSRRRPAWPTARPFAR